MKKFYAQLPLFLFIFLASSCVFAEDPTGIGAVATNLMAPVSVISDFVYSACWIIGSGFLFASVVKYFEHRRSPLMVPMGTVVFLFIAGGILIALPFLSLYSDDPSIRFSFFNQFIR